VVGCAGISPLAGANPAPGFPEPWWRLIENPVLPPMVKSINSVVCRVFNRHPPHTRHPCQLRVFFCCGCATRSRVSPPLAVPRTPSPRHLLVCVRVFHTLPVVLPVAPPTERVLAPELLRSLLNATHSPLRSTLPHRAFTSRPPSPSRGLHPPHGSAQERHPRRRHATAP